MLNLIFYLSIDKNYDNHFDNWLIVDVNCQEIQFNFICIATL